MIHQFANEPIAVIAATGHTGRFVVAELERRGFRTLLIARDAQKLETMLSRGRGREMRISDLDSPAALDAAVNGSRAVINCAGPFLDTAPPVIEAALRAGIHYLDLTAEQVAVQSAHTHDADARRAGVTVVPAAAFFGGLADLLATSVLGNATEVDEITIAVALDSWHPTRGTRLTGARNTARRLIVRGGSLQPLDAPEPIGAWTFPDPFGDREVVLLPFSETITLSHHLNAAGIESWFDRAALRDVADSATPAPKAIDERGRSAQQFVMDVVVRIGDTRLRATAFGRDIYAVSAPIVVEALERVLASEPTSIAGVRSLGEISDARAFLGALVSRGELDVTDRATHERYEAATVGSEKTGSRKNGMAIG